MAYAARHTARKRHRALREAARALVLARLAHYNRFYGAPIGRVFIRDQKTRWGSCSSKGNLNFNWRIVSLAPEAADYVVVHELCHLREFNHSPRFWTLVARAVPEYKEMRKNLRRIRIGQDSKLQIPTPPKYK